MRQLKTIIRSVLAALGIVSAVKAIRLALKSRAMSGRTHEDIFTQDMYQRRKEKGENVSGPGSSLEETEALRAALPALLKKYNIKSIIDLPCGNYFWFQHLDYSFETYKGYDIVDEVIAENNKLYANNKRSFEVMNCLNGDIGDADIILVRDLLIHFSNEDIFKFFKNLQRAHIPYILTTSYRDTKKNEVVATGVARPINLTKAPFHFPEPLDFILEESRVFEERFFNSRGMGLWRTEDIYKILEQHDFYNRLSPKAAA